MLDVIENLGGALAPSNRERDDNYHAVIYSNGNWRVIASRCNIQWIIQRRVKTVDGRRWDGKSYCTTRKALIREWHLKSGDYNGAVALGILPSKFGGADA